MSRKERLEEAKLLLQKALAIIEEVREEETSARRIDDLSDSMSNVKMAEFYIDEVIK